MELVIANVYARGLYAATEDAGNTDEVRDELRQIESISRANPMLCRFLQDPAISKNLKKEKLDVIFKGRVTDETLHFLDLLVDKGRVAHFHKIVSEFVRIDDEKKNVAEGVIESVVPLTDEQLQKFNSEVSTFYGKSIKLKNRVNKKLIGGVKIYAEGRLIDASFSSRLDRLYESIRHNAV